MLTDGRMRLLRGAIAGVHVIGTTMFAEHDIGRGRCETRVRSAD